MTDAKFEDGGETPLALQAADAEDLNVLAALTQDAVFPITEMTWDAEAQRFGVLLNRFRWEDEDRARKQNRAFERVQSVLLFDGVTKVATSGLDLNDKDTVLSLLAIGFREEADAGGTVELVLAGDGGIRLQVDVLAATLQDVTRPYAAPSKTVPSHALDE